MRTKIIQEKGWILLGDYSNKIITLSKGDLVIINGNEYIVKYNILDLDVDLIKIIVNENF